MKPVISLLIGLLSVVSLGPHVAVVLIALGEMAVAYMVLPVAPSSMSDASREKYRQRRRQIFHKRRRRLMLWGGCVFVGIVFSNGFGVPGVDYAISLSVGAALVWQTINTARRADEVFSELLQPIGALLNRSDTSPLTDSADAAQGSHHSQHPQ